MKGVVFTEFLDMVETKFGLDVADRIIVGARLDSKGAYTSVGTYDHQELLRLVQQLAQETGQRVSDLVRTYGIHLFGRFVVMYPTFFQGVHRTLDFLETIEQHIHREVRKLYPDAELPHFTFQRPSDDRLELVYRSSRPFADLAEGLIAGCAQHFGERISIERTAHGSNGSSFVRFSIRCTEAGS